MDTKKTGYLHARLNSFGYAFQGIRQLVLKEAHSKIHLAATVLVIAAGFLRHISRYEWVALVFAVALVWVAEAFNTAIEILCDIWCRGAYHPKVKLIKDIAAGGVLIASIASIVIAFFVFC